MAALGRTLDGAAATRFPSPGKGKRSAFLNQGDWGLEVGSFSPPLSSSGLPSWRSQIQRGCGRGGGGGGAEAALCHDAPEWSFSNSHLLVAVSQPGGTKLLATKPRLWVTSTTLPLPYSWHISEALATVAGCGKSAGLTPRTPLLEGWRRVASAHRPEDSGKRWRGAKGRRASGVLAGCLHRSLAEPLAPLSSGARLPHQR